MSLLCVGGVIASLASAALRLVAGNTGSLLHALLSFIPDVLFAAHVFRSAPRRVAAMGGRRVRITDPVAQLVGVAILLGASGAEHYSAITF